jgi:hypothetical protein
VNVWSRSFWLLLGAGIVAFVAAYPDELITDKIEDKTESRHIYSAEQISVAHIACEKQTMRVPCVVGQKCLDVGFCHEISGFFVGELAGAASDASWRERRPTLFDGINNARQYIYRFDRPFCDSIEKKCNTTTVIDRLPLRVTLIEDKLTLNAHRETTLFNRDNNKWSLQSSQGAFRNVSNPASQPRLAAGNQNKDGGKISWLVITPT